MRKPMIRFAAAGVIVAVVVLGLPLFTDTDKKSGVVWADVARKVQTSRGVIYRERIVNSKYPDSSTSDYTIVHLSATHYRSDGYRSGEPWITMYDDRAAGQRIVLLHGKKRYVNEDITLTEAGDKKHADAMDPKRWVERFLSCNYAELGQRTVEGELCEGIETTDPRLAGEGADELQIDSLVARLWVSVETGYPVLLDGEFKGQHSGTMVFDQFQWEVRLETDVFEPNIPPDYEQM